MAKKFICITQSDGIATFNGVSGTQYTSYLGESFPVENTEDIAQFEKNTRFEIEGFLKKPKLDKPTVASLEDDLKELSLSKKSLETLTASYETLEILRAQVLAGNDLTGDISKTDAEKVRKFIIPNKDNLDNVGKNDIEE